MYYTTVYVHRLGAQPRHTPKRREIRKHLNVISDGGGRAGGGERGGGGGVGGGGSDRYIVSYVPTPLPPMCVSPKHSKRTHTNIRN